MGFFEGLDAEAYDRKYRDRDLLRRIFGYFRPQRGRMLVVGVFTILMFLWDLHDIEKTVNALKQKYTWQ